MTYIRQDDGSYIYRYVHRYTLADGSVREVIREKRCRYTDADRLKKEQVTFMKLIQSKRRHLTPEQMTQIRAIIDPPTEQTP